jgi:predicted nucleic acid-binding protein
VPEDVVGLDTSVVMRILTGEPEKQANAAQDFVRGSLLKGIRLVISDLVIAEAYFALVTHYGVSKREAVAGLLDMMDHGAVEPLSGESVVEILRDMQSSSQKPGLIDRLIHSHYASLRAQMATFEKSSRKLLGVHVLAG